jgi:hypothetical protein
MHARYLLRRIRSWCGVLIIGLVLSGVTAIPLETELNLLASWVGADGGGAATGLAQWIARVRESLQHTNANYPFMAYGTDWLAFGHVVIALAMVGAWRDPVRNKWLFQFAMIACVLVVPWALIFGAVRGIPFGWRLIDCSFGVGGIVPAWLCWRWAQQLETSERRRMK